MAIVDVESEARAMTRELDDDFRELFDSFAPAVHHFFARRGFPPEDCHDLAQDTFLKVYKGLGSFRRDADVGTWILSIAANVWKNALRSRQATKRAATTVPLDAVGTEPVPSESTADAVGASRAPSPLQSVLAAEGRQRLRSAIDDLPPRMRHCVRLRTQRGLKYREIAAILQVSVDTVKTQLHQARQRLREVLDDASLGDDDS